MTYLNAALAFAKDKWADKRVRQTVYVLVAGMIAGAAVQGCMG
jgi:hypothetical protein